MSTIVRPTPRKGVYEIPFWDFINHHEFRLQKCSECGTFRFPPGPTCPQCLSMKYEWSSVSGRGKVLSWVVFRKQYFTEITTPYVVAAVELQEGPIIIADMVNSQAEEMRINLPVEISFEPVSSVDGEEWMIYRWKLKTS